MSVPRNSVGVWAFGPAVTRFVPPGYHSEVANEPMAEKTKRVAEGLSDLLEGLEYHYPGEVNEENADEILSILQDYGMDLPVIAAGLHTDPAYALGAFINPDDELRRQGIDTLKRGMWKWPRGCRPVRRGFFSCPTSPARERRTWTLRPEEPSWVSRAATGSGT